MTDGGVWGAVLVLLRAGPHCASERQALGLFAGHSVLGAPVALDLAQNFTTKARRHERRGQDLGEL